MKLVIAEKPSQGVALARVLGATTRREGYLDGNGFVVSWCIGHLAGLAEASVYDERYKRWNRADLPIIPDVWKFVVTADKRKQFNVLKNLMKRKEIESIICATDAGREGELIFRLVYQLGECKKPVSRLWISSMEESAIKKGFAELRAGSEYDALYQSALCRAKADWLVGINATRLFSTMYNKTLNVGRVQTPTLAMIVERQDKIGSFVKEKYHIVKLKMDGIEAASEHIPEQEEAERIRAACQNGQAVCVSLGFEWKTVTPPKLFDLTSLQRDSNRLFGFTAKQTLDAAQKLYESKLITYPRTDSRFLTSDMEQGLSGIARSAAAFIGVGGITINTRQVINDKKVSDHHAIIPTAEIANTSASALGVMERKVYFLIASRFVCALGEVHGYDSVTASFLCDGHTFTARGKGKVIPGWKEVDDHFRRILKIGDSDKSENSNESGGETEDSDGTGLARIMEGQVFDGVGATVSEHFTKPPVAYTEDTLLSAMERAGAGEMADNVERVGLGTPATRAAVIEKLVSGGFVIRKGKQLVPSQVGVNLIRVLPEVLKSAELTADWENELADIAAGKESPERFMRRIEDMARGLVRDNTKPIREFGNNFSSDKIT